MGLQTPIAINARVQGIYNPVRGFAARSATMIPMFVSTLIVWLSLAAVCLTQTVPVIQTTSGRLHGKAVTNKTNAYLGIPYAQPPVGPLRFLAPRPLLTPATARNTTAFGLSCIQLGGYPPDPSPAGEDCLTVNVWTSPSRKPKPVFVWIYGGSWTTGFAGTWCKWSQYAHASC